MTEREQPEPETRTTAQPVELRSTARRSIGGYGAVFDSPSNDLGGWTEIIDRRAFNKSAGDQWVGAVARWDHSDALLLGTTKAKTLRLTTDSTGLFYEVDLPQSRSDLLELVTRGDVTDSSFAFQAWIDDWGVGADGRPQRQLLSVRLIDVAPLSGAPAYPDATVGLRSLARHVGAPIADVIDLSNRHELRKLFTRSDRPGPPRPVNKDGRVALAETLGRRWPEEPPQPKTGQQALIEVLGRRWPEEPSRPRSGREALTELLGKRWPQ